MIQLTELRNRFGSKPLLISIALALLVLNVVRVGGGYYQEKKETVSNRLALLERSHASVEELPELQRRVAILERRKELFEEHLLGGNSEEEIASAMQIMLQEQLVKAGLEPESLRPITSGESSEDKDYGELSIKVRSTGTLDELVVFLANLYRSPHLFQIESFTFTPHNERELKIFIDFKGYYKLA
jgi:hypothetical protein